MTAALPDDEKSYNLSNEAGMSARSLNRYKAFRSGLGFMCASYCDTRLIRALYTIARRNDFPRMRTHHQRSMEPGLDIEKTPRE